MVVIQSVDAMSCFHPPFRRRQWYHTQATAMIAAVMRSRLPTAAATDEGIMKRPISDSFDPCGCCSFPPLSRSGLTFGTVRTETSSIETKLI